MKHKFICIDCAKEQTGKLIQDLSVDEFNSIEPFSGDKCPKCNGSNLLKLLGLQTAYVAGYGFADKKGRKRDMDMHLMVTGNDPYKEQRKPGDEKDVIRTIQKSRERNVHPSVVRMGKK